MSTHRDRTTRKAKILRTRAERRKANIEIGLKVRMRKLDPRFKDGRPPKVFTSKPHMLLVRARGGIPEPIKAVA